jgi:hypothetical protein
MATKGESESSSRGEGHSLSVVFAGSRDGGTGRRAGLKIPFLHGSVGSIPTLGTCKVVAK